MAASIEGLRQSLPLLAPKGQPPTVVQHLEDVVAQMQPAVEDPPLDPPAELSTSKEPTPTMNNPLPQTPSGSNLQPSQFDPRVTSRLPSTLIRQPFQTEGKSKNPYAAFFAHQNCTTRWEFYNVLCEVQFILNCHEQRLIALEAQIIETKVQQESKVMYRFNPPTPTAMEP
ncbi:hypothetical protein CT0861_07765 [Colletotrichum tofieldiae]|uniref:Uncharacterized protein n=1 Tax=Colletotrichum tofieldiae TaxID=708197 RepID=A0A166SNK4_9PEZI|nr:hypothetical protein CT0861_07765 [Colletotrichum tofieldiae]